MRALSIAVLALVYLIAPAFAMDLKAENPSPNIEEALPADQCTIVSQDNFINQVETAYKQKAKWLSKEGLDKLVAFVNADRAKAKLFPYEADNFAFMFLTEPGKEPRVGMAFFFRGCLLPGTAITMTMEGAAKFFVDAGVTEADFRDKANG